MEGTVAAKRNSWGESFVKNPSNSLLEGEI
jgi:hypothetical protein